jgi:hypothetical protein
MIKPRIRVELESRISLRLSVADESIGSNIADEVKMRSSTDKAVEDITAEIDREVAVRQVVEVPMYRTSVDLA